MKLNRFIRTEIWHMYGVAQWVVRLTRKVEFMGSSPIKFPCCFLGQET